jgi:hypothetical protein
MISPKEESRILKSAKALGMFGLKKAFLFIMTPLKEKLLFIL